MVTAGVVILGLVGGLLIALAAGAVEGAAATYSLLAVQWHAADLRVGMGAWGFLLLALYAIGAPLAGLLADRLKGHAVFVGAVLLAAAASVVLGLTHWVFLINLAVVGVRLGLALLLPSLLVVLLKAIGSRRLYATVAGLYLGALGLGQFLGSKGLRLFGEGPSGNRTSSLFVATGLIALAAGVLGVGAVAGFALLGRAHPRPDDRLAALSGRSWAWTLALVAVVVLCARGVLAGQQTWFFSTGWGARSNALLLTYGAGTSPVAVLAFFLCGPLADLCDGLSARWTGWRWGRAAVLILGALVVFCGAVLYVVGAESSLASWALVVTGVGVGMLGPPALALLSEHLAPSWWGLGVGLYVGIGTLGGVLSAYANGWLKAVTSVRIGAALGLLPAGLLLAVGLVLPWLQPVDTRDAPQPVAAES